MGRKFEKNCIKLGKTETGIATPESIAVSPKYVDVMKLPVLKRIIDAAEIMPTPSKHIINNNVLVKPIRPILVSSICDLKIYIAKNININCLINKNKKGYINVDIRITISFLPDKI